MRLHKATFGVRVRRDKERSKNENIGPPTLGQEGAGKGRASTLPSTLCPWSCAVHNLCGHTWWSGAEQTLKEGAEKQLGGRKGSCPGGQVRRTCRAGGGHGPGHVLLTSHRVPGLGVDG